MLNSSNNSSTSMPETVRIIWDSMHIVTGSLIVIVNLPTIVTFVINRHLRRCSVYCLINLAVADMLFGCFVVFLFSAFIGYNNSSTWMLSIAVLNFISESTLIVSLLSLVLVSLDRVYATFFPFRYRTTRFRVYVVVIAITWSMSPILPLTVQHLDNTYNSLLSLYTSYMGLLLLCLLIICISYTAIFVQVKIQTKRIQLNQQSAAIQTRHKREQHLAMTLFIVTVLSLATWLPFISFFIKIVHFDAKNVYKSYEISFLMQRVNSLINPIIYVFRMKDFRKALARLIFSRCTKDQQQTPPVIRHHGNYNRQQQQPIELELMPQ